MKIIPKRAGLASHLRSHEHPGGIIVCEQSKFIYMKPAKTAGTSILRASFEKEVSGIFHLKDQPDQFQEWVNRITDEELEEYYIFSVVRNPWDRLVSLAAYFKVPFKEFIQNIDDYWEDKNIRIHSLPLSLYTHIGDSQFVDFICRFECLQPDINLVFDHIGINRQQLPYVNRSKHKHYSCYYTEYEIKKVQEIYKNDIKNYGYSFQSDTPEELGVFSKVTKNLSRITSRFT